MENEGLLNSISNIMDEKLLVFSNQIDSKFDVFDKKVDTKFDAFSEQVDAKFDNVNKRLDYIEFKQDHTAKQLSDLKLHIQITEKDIRGDIRKLNDTVETLVEVLRIHDMIPQ